jgi:hypothetical protein
MTLSSSFRFDPLLWLVVIMVVACSLATAASVSPLALNSRSK